MANHGTASVNVALGTGNGGMGAFSSFTAGGAPIGLAVADFTGDSIPDIAVANRNDVQILKGDGSGSFAPFSSVGGGGAYALAVGDFNNDGVMDLAVANEGSATVSILINNGTGLFSVSSSVAAPNSAEAIAIFYP